MEENNHEIDISPEPNKPEGKQTLDPKSALLPTKEIHSLDSAQRVSAGTLYAQEQSATLPKAPPAPPLPIVEKKGRDSIMPLETYQGDIQQYIHDNNVSTVTIAAAEQDRRAEQAAPIAAAPKAPGTKPAQHIWGRIAAIAGGAVLIASALGTIGYAIIKTHAVPATQAPTAPFIAVDGSADIALSPGDTRNTIMTTLVAAKNHVSMPLGLVGQLRPVLATSTGEVSLDAQTFMSVFTPDIPSQLLRTLKPDFLLGVHSFNQNLSFFIFRVDSYQGAYAGMLEWEKNMRADLLPLFAYTPPPHAQLQAGSSTTPASDEVTNTFVDTIIYNHDARVIENSYGDILFLWTFLDHNTLLIATNPNTVQEVISRLKNAPVITVPGQ